MEKKGKNMYKLELVGITKIIKNKIILEDINLAFESGKIYALTGINGSGKTMLLRCMSGLIKQNSGHYILEGKEYRKLSQTDLNIGVFIENIFMYPDMTGYTNLKFLGDIKKQVSQEEIREWMIKFHLDPDSKLKAGKYSLGMRQKLSIIQAMMEKQNLIMLDEPTNALDEKSKKIFRSEIKKAADEGALVIIASHDSTDINDLCDEEIKISAGRIV